MKKEKMNNNYQKVINFIISFLAIATVFGVWYIKYQQHKLIVLIGIMCILLNSFYIFKKEIFDKLFASIIKYRYLIAGVVFILCVLFKVSGSSIGIYNSYLPSDGLTENSHVLLGKSRSIRSDEFIVQTPYYFSQAYNDFGRINNAMSISGQDMIIGYNSPVKDISLIAKPLVWGYVFLGREYGLSWYWSLKTILCLLILFEFFMIITQKKTYLSMLGSLLITFAPTMQWFFVPHLSDVFIWGLGLLVAGYYFFTANKKWLKNLMIVLTPLLAIAFVLALYPPLQVPVGLIAIALLVLLLIRDKEKITFQKKELGTIFLMFMVAMGIIGYEVWKSKDAISLLYNTDYPGNRVVLGGNFHLNDTFTNLVNMFLPYKNIPYSNSCEVSDFFHLGPICILLFFMMYKKLKERKEQNLNVAKGLTIILIIELVFMLIGFPYLLSKLTLFSYINRMQSVYGFSAAVYTIFIIGLLLKHKDILTNKQKIVSISIFFLSYLFFITKEQLTYLPIGIYLLEILLFTGTLFFILYHKNYLAYILSLCIIVFAGFLINPVTIGIDSITEHALVKEVRSLPQEKEDYILTVDNIVISSLLLANGNKVINAVNYYPDLAKWQVLDPTEENKVYYNRYLHEIVNIVDEKTNYSLVTPDCMKLNINILDIKKLPVRYIITAKDLTKLNQYKKSSMKFIKSVSGYNIYEIEK